MSITKLEEPTEAALALEQATYTYEGEGRYCKAQLEDSAYNADLMYGRDIGESTDMGQTERAIRLEVTDQAITEARRKGGSTPRRPQGRLPGAFIALFSPDGKDVLGVWEETVEQGEAMPINQVYDLSNEDLFLLLEEVTQKGLTQKEREALRSEDERVVAEMRELLTDRLTMAGMPKIREYLDGVKNRK